MSDYSTYSNYDDGFEIEKRMPDGSSLDIDQWADTVDNESSAVSHTWSYFDDGADLLPPAATGPGFGATNPRFYDEAKSTTRPKNYHKGMQRAVSGQIGNTLAAMKVLSQFNVKQQSEKNEAEKERTGETGETGGNGKSRKANEPPSGAVRIWLPSPLPTFVIHGKDGHVVVVDGDEDPIDSRPPPALTAAMETMEGSHREEANSSDKGWNDCSGDQQNQEQNWDSHDRPSESEEKRSWSQNHSPNSLPKEASPPASVTDFFISGGLPGSFPSPILSENSWKDDPAEETKSNYQAPAVEDAPETPQNEREYLNGYDEPYETYCNANWGGIPVRVGSWAHPW